MQCRTGIHAALTGDVCNHHTVCSA